MLHENILIFFFIFKSHFQLNWHAKKQEYTTFSQKQNIQQMPPNCCCMLLFQQNVFIPLAIMKQQPQKLFNLLWDTQDTFAACDLAVFVSGQRWHLYRSKLGKQFFSPPICGCYFRWILLFMATVCLIGEMTFKNVVITVRVVVGEAIKLSLFILNERWNECE